MTTSPSWLTCTEQADEAEALLHGPGGRRAAADLLDTLAVAQLQRARRGRP